MNSESEIFFLQTQKVIIKDSKNWVSWNLLSIFIILHWLLMFWLYFDLILLRRRGFSAHQPGTNSPKNDGRSLTFVHCNQEKTLPFQISNWRILVQHWPPQWGQRSWPGSACWWPRPSLAMLIINVNNFILRWFTSPNLIPAWLWYMFKLLWLVSVFFNAWKRNKIMKSKQSL